MGLPVSRQTTSKFDINRRKRLFLPSIIEKVIKVETLLATTLVTGPTLVTTTFSNFRGRSLTRTSIVLIINRKTVSTSFKSHSFSCSSPTFSSTENLLLTGKTSSSYSQMYLLHHVFSTYFRNFRLECYSTSLYRELFLALYI